MYQFIKNILILSCPLIFIVLGYWYWDPFKVVKSYNNYSYSSLPCTEPNRDYMSTQKFFDNYKQYKYNSFVFGSSRTLAFKPLVWKKYLSKDANPYMFDASCETLWGIYKKLVLLDKLNVKVDNAIIILCRDVNYTSNVNSNVAIFRKHPAVSNESFLAFHFQCINTYLKPKFLFRFLISKFTNRYYDFMSGYIDNRRRDYDPITNGMSFSDLEHEISSNPDSYYKKHPFKQIVKEDTCRYDQINNDHKFMFKEIKRILLKHQTNYKIVLSPLYDQMKMSSNDMANLKLLFGHNLYDYSGKNTYTSDFHHYYEESHFRPMVGDSILLNIYNSNINN